MADARTPHQAFPAADDVHDAGSLGCGDGPPSEISAKLKAMAPGSVLEIRSDNNAVASELSPWCRLTGHTYLGGGEAGYEGRYFVRRKSS